MQFANRNPQNHPTQGNSYHPQTSICRATHAWIYCVFSGSKKAGSRFAYTDRNLHRQNGVFMAISLSLDQKEKAKHGEQLFPLQRYITNLSSTYRQSLHTGIKRLNLPWSQTETALIRYSFAPTLSMQEILYLCLPWFFIPSIPIPILQWLPRHLSFIWIILAWEMRTSAQ